MSVIIRLQNLPWSANALDIRQFFKGLSIPEGGVHIVGGELGDAFIAFSTDEDARQAFNRNGGSIKEVQIKLLLSSRTEMQKVIEAARNPLAAFMQKAAPAVLPAVIPAVVPEVTKKSDHKEKDKRDRRRSRSRSRDRRDRSRERDSRERDRRDRRRRGRSRSRSRDRRDRRRRDRSRSRDRRSKEIDRVRDQKSPEDKPTTPNILNPADIVSSVQKEANKGVVWTNNVPVVQSPTILNTLLPAHLRQSSLLLNYRNGLPHPAEALNINRVVSAWNASALSNQSNLTARTFQDELKAVSSIMASANRISNLERDTRPSLSLTGSPRISRFDVLPEKTSTISELPPSLRGPHPLDRLDGKGTLASSEQSGYDRSERSSYDRSERSSYDRSERSSFDRSQRTDRFERQVIQGCCIELSPFYGGYSEIRKFFNGLFIHNNGIKFVNDEYGKRTGFVYIRFAGPTGKKRALERNGMMLRDFNVELNPISDAIFNRAVDRYQPPPFPDTKRENDDSKKCIDIQLDYSCLAIDDLPLFTKEQEILKIFADYPIQQIVIENKQKHFVAYIKFNTSSDAQRAAKDQSNHYFDGKPLNIRMCSDEEFYTANQERDDITEVIDDDDSESPAPIETDCVSLSGLPKKTTDRDVSDFFSDVAIVPKKIHLISSNFGFTGQAYCEFSTIQDAQTASQKNNLPLGSGIVKVIPILRSEMEQSISLAIPRDPIKQPLFNVPHVQPPVIPTSTELPTINRNVKAVAEVRNYEEPVDDRHSEIPSENGNYRQSHEDEDYEPLDDGNYEMSRNDANYMACVDENYDTPPEDENFDLSEDSDFDVPPKGLNYEGSRDNRNYDIPSNDRRLHQMGSYDSMPLMRNFRGDIRDYDHPIRRPFGSDNKIYEPKTNVPNFEPPMSRGMPPPLMSLNNMLPPQRFPPPPPVNPNDIGSPGCTLLMENVPYKAGLDDILAFFDGFRVLADNVLRRYNDNGTPSGEAKVIFNSKEEAYQALKVCNLQKLRERTIYLTQC